METALGPARWVHLTGDAATLPPIAPRTQPKTWASLAGDAPFTALSQRDGDRRASYERWTSADGLRWTSERVTYPIDADGSPRTMGEARPGFRLDGLWRSDDGRTWDAIDVSGVIPDGPEALRWEVEVGYDIASTDAVTVVGVSVRAIEPFTTLDWPQFPGPGDLVELEPGLIRDWGSEVFGTPDRTCASRTSPGACA